MSGGFINDGLLVQKYTYDFSVDGGAVSQIILSNKANKDPLPIGAVVVNMLMHVQTAFTSGGSATLTVGNGDNPDGYFESIAVASLIANSCWLPGSVAGALIWDDTNDNIEPLYIDDTTTGQVLVEIGTAAMTAGKAHVHAMHIKSV